MCALSPPQVRLSLVLIPRVTLICVGFKLQEKRATDLKLSQTNEPSPIHFENVFSSIFLAADIPCNCCVMEMKKLNVAVIFMQKTTVHYSCLQTENEINPSRHDYSLSFGYTTASYLSWM